MRLMLNRLVIALLTVSMGMSLCASADPYKAYKADPNAETAFAYLHQVATHPRCANCHGVVEEGVHHPTVGDERRAHPMNISSLNNLRLAVVEGKFVQLDSPHPVNCRSCHQNSNGDEPGMPPGAANDLMPGFVWHMPPSTMAIEPGMTAKTLCNNWLDPARNSFLAFRGSREQMDVFAKEFEHHVSDDPLVRWSWSPGPGRSPAPGTHEDFAHAMEVWIEGGAPCPSE